MLKKLVLLINKLHFYDYVFFIDKLLVIMVLFN